MSATPALLCPSAQPWTTGAHVHGVVDAASGRIAYLDVPVPVSPELLASTAPLMPTQVLRLSAPCMTDACGHYTGSACSLVDRLVQILPDAAAALPRCSIRPTCMWFSQRGKHACLRCDSVVTDDYTRRGSMALLATEPNHHAV